MELHEQLAALAAQRGREVFANPDGLRAALEDFLDEQSASVGELNLLVDAVRLGGLAQVEANLARGAQPDAAVAAAGEFLARQRGTTEQGSCQWACAALGYAVGMVPAPIVQRLRDSYRSSGAPLPPQSGQPAQPPTVSPAYPTAPMAPAQGGWSAPQQPWSPQMVAGAPGAQSWGAPPAKKSKGPLIAVGVAVAAVLIGGGVVWAVVGSGDDNDKKSASDPTSKVSESGGSDTPKPSGDALAEKSPVEIRDAVVAQMKDVKSLNMAGEVTTDGEEMTMDISMDTTGRCQGTMEMQGGRAEIVSDGTDMYMKGNEQFWIVSSGEANPEQFMLDMFSDKWVRMAGSAADADEFCDLDNMLSEFVGNSGSDVDFTVKGTTIHNGSEAVELTSDDGGTMLVANYAPYHVLKLVDTGDEPGDFEFSRYNEELNLNIPKDYMDIPS
ncbi:hypothetical protein ACLM5J_03705 [Nocardioides sp. Bht2]|uniref:hypothetical protein n=1 Tax=Nocardioides sp. Bht2 TaxID=3392297 RepID=UPI0039B6170E